MPANTRFSSSDLSGPSFQNPLLKASTSSRLAATNGSICYGKICRPRPVQVRGDDCKKIGGLDGTVTEDLSRLRPSPKENNITTRLTVQDRLGFDRQKRQINNRDGNLSSHGQPLPLPRYAPKRCFISPPPSRVYCSAAAALSPSPSPALDGILVSRFSGRDVRARAQVESSNTMEPVA